MVSNTTLYIQKEQLKSRISSSKSSDKKIKTVMLMTYLTYRISNKKPESVPLNCEVWQWGYTTLSALSIRHTSSVSGIRVQHLPAWLQLKLCWAAVVLKTQLQSHGKGSASTRFWRLGKWTFLLVLAASCPTVQARPCRMLFSSLCPRNCEYSG